MSSALISINHLRFGFHDRPLYSDLNFTLAQGSLTSLIGANGVGKTTLVRLIMGELQPVGGTITRMPGLRLGTYRSFATSTASTR